ncbi:MAG: sigma 54-interacting transcriptional regulator [Desulfobaccales bacterium]
MLLKLIMEAALPERQIQVLHEVGQGLGQVLNLEQALEALHQILCRSTSLKHVSVTLKDPENGQWHCRASRDLLPEGQSRAGCRPGEGLPGSILMTAQPFVIPARGQEPLLVNQTRARQLPKEQISFIGVPLLRHGSPLGVLLVDRLFGGQVSLEEDVRFLSIMAALLSPFLGPEELERVGEESLELENPALRLELSGKARNFSIVGQSPAILKAQQLLTKLAPGRAPVLLIGESGTGKALMARMTHALSPRARYPFLKINCASLPENLLAAELLGYEKDAIPGAVKARPGRLEEADGGSIFLEEIAALPLNLQAGLVRFLQEMEIQRLGSSRTRKVDVRLLADTFQDLDAAVQAGSFREDLYYLLSHGSVRIPPLRERRPDIPLLLNHFLDKVSKENGQRFYLTQEALEILQDYAWPGNVREMENLVERLGMVVAGPEIGVKDLPPYLAPARKAQAADQAFLARLKDMEKREILAALERNRWIQSQAAMDLGLTLRQIGYRVKQFGLETFIKEQRGQNRSE